MSYQRTNWSADEIRRALANPVHSPSGPHAHSSKHAVEGELAQNTMFQKARTTAVVYDSKAKESNYAAQQVLTAQKAAGALSNTQYKNQMKLVPLPAPEATRHSTLDSVAMSSALSLALNHPSTEVHLGQLDTGADMKVHVNFSAAIGAGTFHATGQASRPATFNSLFVYLKPCPSNADIPIFQTVVPAEAHKAGGGDPIIVV